MRRISRLLPTLVACSLVLGACGGDDDDDETVESDGDATTTVAASGSETDTTDAPATTLAEEEGIQVAPTIALAETSLGDTLVNADGKTLYAFANDSAGQSTCTEGCATAWPPVTVDGDPVIGDGLDASRFSTFARADGPTQVAYDDMPLYAFSGDAAAGDANGHGLGGVWSAVGPSGEIGDDPVVQEEAAADVGSDY
ncbi:MAG: COG4315 family predicted lipoprotein [Actinomycetota bacterium]